VSWCYGLGGLPCNAAQAGAGRNSGNPATDAHACSQVQTNGKKTPIGVLGDALQDLSEEVQDIRNKFEVRRWAVADAPRHGMVAYMHKPRQRMGLTVWWHRAGPVYAGSAQGVVSNHRKQ
jgi:hypothetical protein